MELQTLAQSKKNESIPPPGKAIRGGRKALLKDEPDIPFIDEGVDAEGNVLSPTSNDADVIVNGDHDVSKEQEETKELPQEDEASKEHDSVPQKPKAVRLTRRK